MSKKKNQHFVPKFYLQRFARNNDKKSINIFLSNTCKFIEQGSIAGQAYRNFYYGKDGAVEDKLGELEGTWAAVLKTIIDDDIPKVGSQRFQQLLEFICFTDFRNPVRADQIEALSDIQGASVRGLYKVMQEEKVHESEKFIKAAQVEMKENKVMESLLHARCAVSIISDLKMKLLVNETALPFLTSDYPIIQYNHYFENRSRRNIPFGLGSWGVQIFVPLSSKHIIILYDKEKYLVGNDKHDVVIVRKKQDVDQLNILQYQSCLNAVYGDEAFTQEYAEFLNKRSAKFQKKREIKHTFEEETPTSHNVFVERFNIRCKLDLSFISLPLSASKNQLNPRRIYIRRAVEEVRRQMAMQDYLAQENLSKILQSMRSVSSTS